MPLYYNLKNQKNDRSFNGVCGASNTSMEKGGMPPAVASGIQKVIHPNQNRDGLEGTSERGQGGSRSS
jgi:hypothetical protein